MGLRITMPELMSDMNENKISHLPWSVREYYHLKDFLDQEFGGPTKETRGKFNGEYTFCEILKHLSNQGPTTCREMGKHQIEIRHSKKHVSIKLETDNFRRFIDQHKNLKLFVEDNLSTKASSKGRPAQKYRLTCYGILYAIHFFCNSDYEYLKNNKHVINNLAKNYSHILPLVFGNFFEGLKIFEKYSEECVYALMAIAKKQIVESLPAIQEYSITETLYNSLESLPNNEEKGLIEQITFGFYIQLWNHLKDKILREKYMPKLIEMNNELKNEIPTERHRKIALNSAKKSDKEGTKIWLKMINSDNTLTDFIQKCVRYNHHLSKIRYETSKNAIELFS